MGLSKCLPVGAPNNQWSYCPSVPAAVVFVLLFGASALVHFFQAIRYRKAFCWIIIMGALWETAAFAFRILSARNPTHKASYDASFLLVLLAPLSINAFDYMLLGRLVQTFLPSGSRIFGIKGSKMGVVFVCFDIISFIVQIGGGLLSLSKKTKTAQLGLHVVIGGLAFQQMLIFLFMSMSISFSRKLRLNTTAQSPERRGAKKLLHVMQASLLLITYRILFRLVEFSSKKGSSMNVYIDHHEFFIYVFDALPMLFALVLMNVWHPGPVLRERSKVYSQTAYAPGGYQQEMY